MKQIGKYIVAAHATGSDEGGWQGHLKRSWVEGGKAYELSSTVDTVLPTQTEALVHAYNHALMQVENGVW